MDAKLSGALIGAASSLIVVVAGGWFALREVEIRLDEAQAAWVRDAEGGRIDRLLECRFEEYPTLVALLAELSTSNRDLDADRGREIGGVLNDWFYSRGGLCAEAPTRGALLQLRNALLNWKDGPRPEEMKRWKDDLVLFLRNDLGLEARRTYDRAEPESYAAFLWRRLQQSAPGETGDRGRTHPADPTPAEPEAVDWSILGLGALMSAAVALLIGIFLPRGVVLIRMPLSDVRDGTHPSVSDRWMLRNDSPVPARILSVELRTPAGTEYPGPEEESALILDDEIDELTRIEQQTPWPKIVVSPGDALIAHVQNHHDLAIRYRRAGWAGVLERRRVRVRGVV